MATVKECMLKNIKKSKNPYVRAIAIGYTGFDISYGTEKQALKFVSQNIATLISQDLRRYGDFRFVEVGQKET